MLSVATNSSSFAARRVAGDAGARPVPIYLPINYEQELESVKHFLLKFGPSDAAATTTTSTAAAENEHAASGKYMNMLQEVADLKRTTITVDLDDLVAFGEGSDNAAGTEDLVQRITRNTYRYVQLFSRAIDEIMPASRMPTDLANMDVINVILSHRKARLRAKKGQITGHSAAEQLQDAAASPEDTTSTPADQQHPTTQQIPAALLRRYTLTFKPISKAKLLAVRQIKSPHVGSLVRLRGIITRVSEVKPLLTVGTYTCETCGYEVYQEVTSQVFMPIVECPSEECSRNNVKGQLYLQSRGSRFLKFQEARMQELADQVPIGHIPRSLTIQLYGELTRTINPGDQVNLSGIFMPRPYSGWKAVKAGLLTDTYIYAMHIEQIKQRYEVPPSVDTTAEASSITAEVEKLAHNPQAYERLARSIAPEIYGHVDVKKTLLLLMVGGVTRELADGMKIRGDINICLMGDPGVAKSQLLKYICKIAPRAVYTTGKGSSGVGLTAAVTKDPVTNEMVLEGGALVLADNGICCIDEFDKMDESDRTAIHEVMEQQTISISKAGITTTLNARSSIIAAANPLHGRYNTKKSPKENINLPPALLSRFDILFLILDRADVETDTRLAEHVTHVHRTNKAPAGTTPASEIVSPDTFRQFIGTARKFSPVVPQNLVEYIVGAYVSLRLNDLNAKDSTYTTARTLLAVLRLSQALAKIRFSDFVNQADVDEAMRLMEVSRSSVDLSSERPSRTRESDPITRIFAIIRDLATTKAAVASSTGNAKELAMDLVRERVRSSGFTDVQLQQCLVEFDQCNIWAVSPAGDSLKIYN